MERDAIYVAYSLFGKDRYISAEEFSKSVRLLAERLDFEPLKANPYHRPIVSRSGLEVIVPNTLAI